MDQDTVIDQFVAHLSEVRKDDLEVVSRPDRINRNTEDIDAVISGKHNRIALEHTTIDTFPGQRDDSNRFNIVFGALEKELNGKFKGNIHITASCYSIPVGQNWNDLRKKLRSWLIDNIPNIPYGHEFHDIPNTPFEIHINKKPSKEPRFFVARFSPNDETLSERLAVTIARKERKLSQYKKEGFETILLIENDDIALMNEDIMTDSFNDSTKVHNITHLNQVWFVDTSLESEILFSRLWENMIEDP